MEFWYLYHSGFAVKTTGHFLIFDCYQNQPLGGGLSDGVIDPAEVGAFGLKTVAFASHRHGDHYKRHIFQWRDTLPQLIYILSDDIRTKSEAVFIGPHQELLVADLRVQTLESTDLGVAFLVEADGLTIFHAGDLNWWDWEGESQEYREDMGRRYRAEMDRLKGRHIDLAFLPVDPRLEQSYRKGLDYFMEQVGADHVVPMHFGEEIGVCHRLLEDEKTEPYREKLIPLHHRGEHVVLPG